MEGIRYVRCRDCLHCRIIEVKGSELRMFGRPIGQVLEWGRDPESKIRNILNASVEVAICLLDDGERLPEAMIDRLDELECWEPC